MIIWSFKGVGTTFRSTPAKHDRDIFRMATACGVSPETEIIYHHGKPNRPTIADTFAVNDDTSNTSQPALQEISGPSKPRRKKATSVSDVPGDVAEPSTTPDTLWDTTDTSTDSFGSDSVAEQ